MAGTITNQLRDATVTLFRERMIERLGWTPFPHQREWWAASDGLELQKGVLAETGLSVLLPDGRVERWLATPRPNGRARVIADLGAFKSGKSMSGGYWAAGFGAVPNGRISLVGMEYDICAPEFDYICEALLSERGMGIKPDSLQNRPRDGKMWLDLPNGCRFEAKSWERKESLKGKEIDVYLFTEAYQLPGMECYSSVKQNLVAREGYAVFPTTPDRPWVKEFHDHGHGDPKFPTWQCVCNVPRSVNPYTYSAEDEEQDRSLMTNEKFVIAHLGQLGDFVGKVFNYQRGGTQFHAGNWPELFPRGGGQREDLVVPQGWEIVSGADTGTYYTALTVAFSPGGDAFVIDEFPNYRYVAGAPERDESITIPQWAAGLLQGLARFGGRPFCWADRNTQFKQELRQYGINLLPAAAPVETRTEIAREYFQAGKIWLAPWLQILPFELENACWPDEASAAGKFARVKDRDHTLDCLEHVLARRPRGKVSPTAPGSGRWLDSYTKGMKKRGAGGNPSLGAL